MTIIVSDLGIPGFALTVFVTAVASYAIANVLLRAIRRWVVTNPGRSKPVATSGRPQSRGAALARACPITSGPYKPAPVAPERTGTGAGLDTPSQIERLVVLIGDQSERADVTQSLHRRAGQQLDLASYAIQTLVKELNGIVPSLATAAKEAPPPAALRTSSAGLPLAA